MNVHGLLERARRRLLREEAGFTLVESVVALGVIFVALLAMAQLVTSAYTDIGFARQRLGASQLANKVLEQVRGLSYQRVAQGLATEDQLHQDPRIKTCADGLLYYVTCPEQDPNSEKIVHTSALPDEVPLVPHKRSFGPPDFTTSYTSRVYVTMAKDVPVAGAFRVTVDVSWSDSLRRGVKSDVTSQSLLYTPEGTTDPGTGVASDAPFFYGTGGLSRGSVTVTPGDGVSAGVGVTGLPSWEELSEQLYGLEANVQAQTLTLAEGRAVMTAGKKEVGGTESISGGEAATSAADDDPATSTGTSQGPLSLLNSSVSASVDGGGNSLQVKAASGPPPPTACPSGQPNVRWMTGWEHGRGSSAMPAVGKGLFDAAGADAGSTVSMDSGVARGGNWSFRAESNAGAAYGVARTNVTGTFVAHFAVRLASLPSSNVLSLFAINDPGYLAGTPTAYFGYRASTNQFRILLENNGSFTAAVESAAQVTAGQWYAVGLRFDVTSSTHRLDWSVDGQAQTQATQSGSAGTALSDFYVGSPFTATVTGNYDDIVISASGSDFPLPDGAVKVLLPDGSGTHSLAASISNETGGTSDSGTWWQKLDEVPMSSTADYVKQDKASTSAYAEFTFQDPPSTDTCIRGVSALLFSASTGSSKENNGQLRIRNGTTETIVWNNTLEPGSGTVNGMGGMVPSGGATWTPTEVTGLRARIGYSNNVKFVIPRWDGLVLQYYAPFVSEPGPDTEGPAGTESGSTTSTAAAAAASACGNPVQLDGRACSYSKQTYSTAGSPFLVTRVDLSGSGGGKCNLYRFFPTSESSATSYAWGRRTAGTGGAGTVKESVLRYPGTHDIGGLCAASGTGPAGWPGFWVRYDAGTATTFVHAEAGIGSQPPSYTSAGVISYWNGSGVSTMTPPPGGGAIPVAPLTHTGGGVTTEISGTLNTAPSFTTQDPPGAVGTADRLEARAVLGSPVVGSFTYKVTNASTGAVLVHLKVAVDLGTLTAVARYAT